MQYNNPHRKQVFYFAFNLIHRASRTLGYGRIPIDIADIRYCYASKITKLIVKNFRPEVIYVKQLSNRTNEETLKHRALIRKEFGILEHMKDACHGNETCSVIEPIECIEKYLALITKEAKGVRLDNLLLAYRPFSTANPRKFYKSFLNAGRWLRCFYEKTSKDESSLPHYHRLIVNLNEDLKVIRDFSSARLWASSCQQQITQALAKSKNIADPLLRPSLCHGDFIPGNILVNDAGETIVHDFSDAGPGLIYSDIATFIQWIDNLRFRRPWISRPVIQGMKSAFIEGFQLSEPESCMVLKVFTLKNITAIIKNAIMMPSSNILYDLHKRLRINFLKNRANRLIHRLNS